MPDAREPNKAGQPPTEPVFQDRGKDGPGIRDPRSVNVDMGQGLPPVRKQPARSGSASGAAIVISALLSLIFGAAGAWAYERYLAQLIAEKFPAASTTQGRDSETPKNLALLDDRIKSLSDQCSNLSDQYKQLQARLDAVPKPTPLPTCADRGEGRPGRPALSADRGDRQEARPPARSARESEKKVTELDAKLDELRKEVSAAHSRAPADRSRDGSPVSSEKGESSIDTALEPGVSQFRGARYREAYDVFQKLELSHPDDAAGLVLCRLRTD